MYLTTGDGVILYTVLQVFKGGDFELLFPFLSVVEKLQNLLFMTVRNQNLPMEESNVQGGPIRSSETLGVTDGNPVAKMHHHDSLIMNAYLRINVHRCSVDGTWG